MADKIKIYVWDDGVWCYEKDIEDHRDKAGYCSRITVDESHIEEAVAAFLRA